MTFRAPCAFKDDFEDTTSEERTVPGLQHSTADLYNQSLAMV